MVPLVFTIQMECPICVEVAAGAERAELKDGLGAGEGPARSGSLHAIFDEFARKQVEAILPILVARLMKKGGDPLPVPPDHPGR